jgi:hypothetical protein
MLVGGLWCCCPRPPKNSASCVRRSPALLCCCLVACLPAAACVNVLCVCYRRRRALICWPRPFAASADAPSLRAVRWRRALGPCVCLLVCAATRLPNAPLERVSGLCVCSVEGAWLALRALVCSKAPSWRVRVCTCSGVLVAVAPCRPALPSGRQTQRMALASV